VKSFGQQRANAAFRTFNQVVNKSEIDTQNITAHIRQRTSYEMRLQILHFLFGIAQADGQILSSELQVLHRISGYFRLSGNDFESIKAMFFKSADEAYKILEVDKDATDAEIKKAYRRMAKKYHPDRLTNMDEA